MSTVSRLLRKTESQDSSFGMLKRTVISSLPWRVVCKGADFSL